MAASASSAPAYLKAFVESVAELPAELRRTFQLMRELDAKAAALQRQADLDARTCLLNGGKAANDAAAAAAAAAGGKRTTREAELQAMRERLDADMKQVLHYCNEKAQLAQQVYDYVDARIRRLDTDLAAFDAQLVSDRVGAGLPPGGWAAAVAAGLPSAAPHKKAARAAAPARKAPAEKGAGGGAGTSGGGGGAGGGGGGGEAGGGAGALAAAGAGMADPAEPVYCTCSRVSFGEMIACDNPDCPVEWFHYECVGLVEAPKGRWVCPSCAAAEAGG